MFWKRSCKNQALTALQCREIIEVTLMNRGRQVVDREAVINEAVARGMPFMHDMERWIDVVSAAIEEAERAADDDDMMMVRAWETAA